MSKKRTCCKRCRSTSFAKWYHVYCGPVCEREARLEQWRAKSKSEAAKARGARWRASEHGQRTMAAYEAQPERKIRRQLLDHAKAEAAERGLTKRAVLIGWRADPGRVQT